MSVSFITLTEGNDIQDVIEKVQGVFVNTENIIPQEYLACSSCREIVLTGADEFQHGENIDKFPYLWVGSLITSEDRGHKHFETLFKVFSNMIESILDKQEIEHGDAKLTWKKRNGNENYIIYGPLSNQMVPHQLIFVNMINAFTKAFASSISSFSSSLKTIVESYRHMKDPKLEGYKSVYQQHVSSYKSIYRTNRKTLKSITEETSLGDIVKSKIINYNLFNNGQLSDALEFAMNNKLPFISMSRSRDQNSKCGNGVLTYYNKYNIYARVEQEKRKEEKPVEVESTPERATYRATFTAVDLDMFVWRTTTNGGN